MTSNQSSRTRSMKSNEWFPYDCLSFYYLDSVHHRIANQYPTLYHLLTCMYVSTPLDWSYTVPNIPILNAHFFPDIEQTSQVCKLCSDLPSLWWISKKETCDVRSVKDQPAKFAAHPPDEIAKRDTESCRDLLVDHACASPSVLSFILVNLLQIQQVYQTRLRHFKHW